ncbi:MAG: response regulator [Spirochaetales bacterium]|nr:response regulator [Spirochaetales bacterium]
MERIKILMVDDEINVLTIVRSFLRHYYFITEISSLKAKETIEQEKFDIYIIDFQMSSDLDGITLLTLIQRLHKNKDYVSIFLTAHGTIYLFKQELTLGLFDFFLEKPFKIDDFKKVFDKAIDKLGKIRNKEN